MVHSKSKSMTVAKPKSPRALMRQPVKARAVYRGEPGHFYVNPKSIDVYGIGVRITREQLEKALALMDLV
jgi:hypothetical protein